MVHEKADVLGIGQFGCDHLVGVDHEDAVIVTVLHAEVCREHGTTSDQDRPQKGHDQEAGLPHSRKEFAPDDQFDDVHLLMKFNGFQIVHAHQYPRSRGSGSFSLCIRYTIDLSIQKISYFSGRYFLEDQFDIVAGKNITRNAKQKIHCILLERFAGHMPIRSNEFYLLVIIKNRCE